MFHGLAESLEPLSAAADELQQHAVIRLINLLQGVESRVHQAEVVFAGQGGASRCERGKLGRYAEFELHRQEFREPRQISSGMDYRGDVDDRADHVLGTGSHRPDRADGTPVEVVLHDDAFELTCWRAVHPEQARDCLLTVGPMPPSSSQTFGSSGVASMP
jgi:hypothetical protein